MLRFLKRSTLQRSIIAALSVFLMAPPLAADEWPHPGTRSQVSGKSFAELVTALNTAIKNNGMFAVTKASASAGAKRRGIDIAGNMVMLAASVEAGMEAPLRFYITGHSDGSASLTYRTPTVIFAPYGSADLDDMAGELDIIFAAIAAQAVAP